MKRKRIIFPDLHRTVRRSVVFTFITEKGDVLRMCGEFDHFTPERFLPDVEEMLGAKLNGYACAFTSYVNRVYELETVSGDRVVAKFYRPGRWTPEAILDEHDFLFDCAEREVSVVVPFELTNGSTLGFSCGIPFSVSPKKRGRESEFETPESFRKVGALLGLIHSAGAMGIAEHRMQLTPEAFAFGALHRLLDSGAVHSAFMRELETLCLDIMDEAECVLPPSETFQRIHGDFHRANVLDRGDEGLLAIDFDDMLNGPAVQDLWLLLPDTPEKCREELNALLEGYRIFMEFDDATFRAVEVLRAMRMIHFLSWCAIQSGDRNFRVTFPDWGTESFWRRECGDLRRQLTIIRRERRNFHL